MRLGQSRSRSLSYCPAVEVLEERCMPVSLSPSISLSGPLNKSEGNAGQVTDFVMRVRLSEPGILPIAVDYATTDIGNTDWWVRPATAGVDYQPTSGRLIFLPGEVEKTFTV